MRKFLAGVLTATLILETVAVPTVLATAEAREETTAQTQFTETLSTPVTSGSCGENLTWSFDTTSRKLTIDGTGEMYDYTSISAPWSGSFKSITIGAGVTSIGDYAFNNCPFFTSITLPEGLVSIGDFAFSSCSELEAITLPTTLTSLGESAFAFSSKLTTITIPDSVTAIGDKAFYLCTALNTVKLGSKLTSIGKSSFQYCESLTSIEIPASVTKIGDIAFGDCDVLENVVIKSSNFTVPTEENNHRGIFENSPLLKTAGEIGSGSNIQFSMTSIPDHTFQNSALESVTFPDGTTKIGDYAFYGSSLEYMIIPTGVTTIGDYAFYDNSLSYAYLPRSILSLGIGSIGSDLEKIHYEGFAADWEKIQGSDNIYVQVVYDIENTGELPKEVTINDFDCTLVGGYASITGYSGSNTSVTVPATMSYNNKTYTVYEANISGDDLSYLTFAEGISKVNVSCSNLVKLKMPSTVTTLSVSAPKLTTAGPAGTNSNYEYAWTTHIPDDAFSWMATLEEITFPSTLTSLGNSALFGCEALTSLTLPESLTSIGTYALADTGLTSINLPKNLSSIGESVFYDCMELSTITVDPDNTSFITEENVLFNKDKTTLIFYGKKKETHHYTMPNTVEIVEADAFSGNSSLYSIDFSNSLEVIRYSAFSGTGLISISLPSTLKSIGPAAFFYCGNLVSVHLEEGMTQFMYDRNADSHVPGKGGTFYMCSNLQYISVPKTMKTLDSEVFSGTGLTDIYYSGTAEDWEKIDLDSWTGSVDYFVENAKKHYETPAPVLEQPEIVTYAIDDKDSHSVLFDKSSGMLLELNENFVSGKIPTVIDGAAVTRMGQSFAYGNQNLSSITLPSTLTTIGIYSFGGCKNLTSILIPQGVISLGRYSFSYCSNLSKVWFPNSITYVGVTAFGDSGLETVYFDGTAEDWSNKDFSLFSSSIMQFNATFPNGTTGNTGGSSGGSSSGNSSSSSTEYTIKTQVNDETGEAKGGSISTSKSKAKEGTEITVAVTPEAGYYLKSITVLTDSGGRITTKLNEDNHHVFTMRDDVVTVVATFALGEGDSSVPTPPETENDTDTNTDTDVESDKVEIFPEKLFHDVQTVDWYYPYVKQVLEEGLMSGMGDGNFGAEEETLRAMIVTTLHSMAGKPTPTQSNGFQDVNYNHYYLLPASWANENGIVSGVGDNLFGGELPVTREAICAMIYRFALTQTDLITGPSYAASFVDEGDINIWAKEAVNWCNANNIVNGYADGTFQPHNHANRGEIATMLAKLKALTP